MKKILISGYYGFDNAGDEAVLASIVQILQNHFSGKLKEELKIVALSANPEKTAKRYGISAVNRRDNSAIKAELKDANLFISGGGSLFQDVTSVRSVYYYASMLHLAHKAKVPAIVLAQGLGPVNTFLGKMMTKNAMSQCEFICWRDVDSLELAKKIGLPAEKMSVTCDPVLLWNPECKCQTVEKTDIKEVGFALRPWKSFDIVPVVAAIESLQGEGIHVSLLPFHHGVDEKLADDINDRLDVKVEVLTSKDPAKVYANVKGLDFLVGMRLHSLVMAASANVPTAAISYDPKIDSFAQLAGIPLIGDYWKITANQIIYAATMGLKNEVVDHSDRFEALWQEPLAKIGEILKR